MLAGKVAFVSGAAVGIGASVAKVLSREGAKVAVVAHLTSCSDTMKSLCGTGHIELPKTDISSQRSVLQAVKSIEEEFGRPADVVVNCAGITKDKVLLKMALEDFNKVIDINLKGTFLINKEFADAIRGSDRIKTGSIINVASIMGQIGNKGQANYSASKAGIIGFTKTAAKELAAIGIRVNCICPGFINTRMVESIPDQVREKLLSQVPLGEMGEPEDVAEVAAFLASERSKYITGAVVNVNGGWL